MKRLLRWFCEPIKEAMATAEESHADLVETLNFAIEHGDTQEVKRIMRLGNDHRKETSGASG